MKHKQISELEQEVMSIVWELEKCSVREVLEKINKEKRLAYTTVATVLQRLQDKGLVVRDDQENAFTYHPKVSKERYGTKMLQTFMNHFFDTFGDVATTSFVESIEKLPKKKREQILQLLETYENK